MTTACDLDTVRADLEEAAAALRLAVRRLNGPNADYVVRDLCRAVEAQQRALETLALVVESDRKLAQAQRQKVSNLEWAGAF